jgi:hypothetical protein
MRAKYFRKLRKQVRIFLVEKSWGMFGDFDGRYHSEVIARNAKEAAWRFMKRHHSLEEFSNLDNTPSLSSKTFGKLKIVPKEKPFERFSTYWD